MVKFGEGVPPASLALLDQNRRQFHPGPWRCSVQGISADAEARAAVFNAGADLSAIRAAAPDEMFSQGNPVLAIGCGQTLIDRRLIGKHFGVGRKKVKLAGAETVLAISGFPVGTVPPFGHRQALETLLEEKVLRFKEAYAGGGEHNALVRLNPADILEVTQATVLDLKWPEPPPQGD